MSRYPVVYQISPVGGSIDSKQQTKIANILGALSGYNNQVYFVPWNKINQTETNSPCLDVQKIARMLRDVKDCPCIFPPYSTHPLSPGCTSTEKENKEIMAAYIKKIAEHYNCDCVNPDRCNDERKHNCNCSGRYFIFVVDNTQCYKTHRFFVRNNMLNGGRFNLTFDNFVLVTAAIRRQETRNFKPRISINCFSGRDEKVLKIVSAIGDVGIDIFNWLRDSTNKNATLSSILILFPTELCRLITSYIIGSGI